MNKIDPRLFNRKILIKGNAALYANVLASLDALGFRWPGGEHLSNPMIIPVWLFTYPSGYRTLERNSTSYPVVTRGSYLNTGRTHQNIEISIEEFDLLVQLSGNFKSKPLATFASFIKDIESKSVLNNA